MTEDTDLLARQIRRLYNPPPSDPPLDGVWERIGAARGRAGQRDPAPARLSTRPARGTMRRITRHVTSHVASHVTWTRAAAALAASVVIVAVAIAAAGSVTEATATQSVLTLSDQTPMRGEPLSVEYRPTTALAHERELVLRARLRTAEGEFENWMQPHRPVARLTRQGSVFRGTLQLPDSVVYAVLAVEDIEATRVDAKGESWEIVVHDTAGRPLRDALMQRYRDTYDRDSRASLETARRLTAHYPASPLAWATWYWTEHARHGASGRSRLVDSLRRAMAHVTAAAQANPGGPPDELYALAGLQELVGDSSGARDTRRRIQREHVGSAEAVELLVDSIVSAHDGDLVAMRRGFEAFWSRVDARHGAALAESALRLADGAKDTADVRRWAARLEPHARQLMRMVIGSITAAYPLAPVSPADDVLRRARQSLAILHATRDQRRALKEGRPQHLHQDRSLEGHYLGNIGRLLHAAGQKQAARDTLARAMALRWNATVLRTVGDIRLAERDTAGAAAAYAWAAADPGVSTASVDSLRERVGRLGRGSAWARAVRDGEQELSRHFLASARLQPLPTRLQVTDSAGGEVVLSTVTRGTITVIALWSPECPRAVTELTQLGGRGFGLARSRARLIVVSGDQPSAGLPAPASRRHVHAMLFDTRQALRQALDQWGYPTYYVLDAAGRVRFRSYGPADLKRQVLALEHESARLAGR